MANNTYPVKYITDKDGNRVLPKTAVSAVVDEQGTPLSTLIASMGVPDEEDLTKGNDGKVRFKNRPNTDGMGKIILRKGIPLSQQMTQANTIYVIQYDFTLGENITVPDNCILEFNGGSISGAYTLTGNNTKIQANKKIFDNNIIFAGTWNCSQIESYWWDTRENDSTYDNSPSLQKGIDLAALNKGGVLHIGGGKLYVSVIIADHSYEFWHMTTGTLQMKSNVHIVMDSGTTIKAIDNTEERYSIFMFFNVENASIEGGSIFGDVDTNAAHKTSEYGYGINICSSNDILIRNCKIGYCHGDGIYIGRHYDTTEYPVDTTNYAMVPHRISILQNELLYNGRQGLTICGAIGSVIENNYICSTGQLYHSNQGYGIDIEPNRALADEKVDDVIISKCSFSNNIAGSIMAADFPVGRFTIFNLKIANCTSNKPERLSLRLLEVYGITISNCSFSYVEMERLLNEEKTSPIKNVSNTQFIKFMNCSFNEGSLNFQKYVKDVILENCSLYISGAGNPSVRIYGNNSNLFFNNCSIYQNNRTAVLVYVGDTYDKIVYNNCSFVSSAAQAADSIGTHNNSVWALGPIYY